MLITPHKLPDMAAESSFVKLRPKVPASSTQSLWRRMDPVRILVPAGLFMRLSVQLMVSTKFGERLQSTTEVGFYSLARAKFGEKEYV